MPTFRKKNPVVDAFNLASDPWSQWFKDAIILGRVQCFYRNRDISDPLGEFDYAVISSGYGTHIAHCRDYVINEGNFRIYPCKPDIFKMTYELVEVQP
jgi:hypothetical protein